MFCHGGRLKQSSISISFFNSRERGLYRLRALLARQRFFAALYRAAHLLSFYLYKMYSLLVILPRLRDPRAPKKFSISYHLSMVSADSLPFQRLDAKVPAILDGTLLPIKFTVAGDVPFFIFGPGGGGGGGGGEFRYSWGNLVVNLYFNSVETLCLFFYIFSVLTKPTQRKSFGSS
jgi:hypothetical protein